MFGIPRYFLDGLLAVVLVGVLLVHYLANLPTTTDLVLLFSVAFIGTTPVVWSALRALREKEWASMDMLASIALVFSLASAEWASAVFIALMLTAARILDALTEERTEKSITGLLKLRPVSAQIEKNGTLTTVPLSEVHVGDVVVVDIGMRVPVDGVVLSGTGAVDESSLTGESLPVDKEKGSRVFSATMLSSGNLRVEVEKIGADTTLEKIIRLVTSSRAERPKTELLGEKFGKLYLVGIFILAGVTLIYTQNVSFVLAVVLVVCADDVAVAIPLAYLGAIGAAAKRGAIVKGAAHLEVLGQARTVVFDKTGTLTSGALTVSDVYAAVGGAEEQVLSIAASAANRSQHPLSRAIAVYAEQKHIPHIALDTFEEFGGKGVLAHTNTGAIVLGRASFIEEQGVVLSEEVRHAAEACSDRGESISYVAKEGRLLGFVSLSDTVKGNARESIALLKELGVVKTVMLTGDNERVAKAMAEKVGIDEYHANLLPEDKVALLRTFREEGIVAMVGDGVNDAAALSAAHVGIAMGAMGYDSAIESADIVLMRDDLSVLPEIIALARGTQRIAVQDFWIWGVTNVLGLGLVFIGFIGPAGAAAYNFITDFIPLSNSVRVRFIQKKRVAKVLTKKTV